jgi:hypothetical protein
LPDSLTELSDFLFVGCEYLRSVTLGKETSHIGRGTFGKCYRLENVVLPKTLSRIADEAFLECHELARIYYRGEREAFDLISVGEDNTAFTEATVVYRYRD